MNIVELRAENHKRLKAVTIRPDGALVLLTGKNDQGKTSALNAIHVALKGISAAGAIMIREGEEQSRLKLDLGELVVNRTFTRAKDGTEITHKLILTREDGSRVTNSPQAVLDAMLGNLTFDPLAFSKWKPGDQFDALRALVKGFDFVEHDKAQRADYADRTEWNRRSEEFAAAAAKVVLPAGSKPEAVVVADLMQELQRCEKENSVIDERVQRRKAALDEVDAKRDQAESLRAQAATLERESDELEEKLLAAPALPQRHRLDPIRAQIAIADSVNAARRAFEAREEHERQATVASTRSKELTLLMEGRDASKKAAIAATKMPVEGLDLTDGAVTLDGLPFSSAGTAKKIRASMAIAMSLNPKLKVVLIDEASELDPEAIGIVAKMAEEAGFQVWLTSAHHDSGRAEILIEDGQVASK